MQILSLMASVSLPIKAKSAATRAGRIDMTTRRCGHRIGRDDDGETEGQRHATALAAVATPQPKKARTEVPTNSARCFLKESFVSFVDSSFADILAPAEKAA